MDDYTSDNDDTQDDVIAETTVAVKGSKTYDAIKSLYTKAMDYWSPTFANYGVDLNFSHGEQWDTKVESDRKSANRPSEVYNLVPSFINPITGAIRQAPPGIQIHPVSNASKMQAKALAGLIRTIENDSAAQTTYCQALDTLCRGGLGAWRVILREDCHGKEKIYIELIPDPTKLVIDPASRALDFSDARFAIYENTMSYDEYHETYPEGHCTEDEGMVVSVFEYWGRLAGGGMELVVYDNSGELDRQIVNIDHIPFIVITADRMVLDGKVTYTSAIRDIKTLQREVNFYKSEALAVLAAAPKSTWMAQEGTLVNQEKWVESSTNPDIVLEYARNAQAPPTQIGAPPPPTGYVDLANGNLDMMRNITGIYPDPSTQSALSGASGKAIKAQIAAGQISTRQWVEALQCGVRLTGDIILDYIKEYWSDDAIRVALGVDGTTTIVSVGPTQVPNAINIDLENSDYKVTVSAGASYNTAVEQAIDRLMEIGQANPAIFPLITDWLVSQINVPGAEELSDRFRAQLPPEVRDMIQATSGNQDPADVIRSQQLQITSMGQQLQQLNQVVQQLQAANQQATQQLQNKSAENEIKLLDIQAKKDINNDNIRAKMTLQDDDQSHQVRMAQMEAKFDLMFEMLTKMASK